MQRNGKFGLWTVGIGIATAIQKNRRILWQDSSELGYHFVLVTGLKSVLAVADICIKLLQIEFLLQSKWSSRKQGSKSCFDFCPLILSSELNITTKVNSFVTPASEAPSVGLLSLVKHRFCLCLHREKNFVGWVLLKSDLDVLQCNVGLFSNVNY